MSGSEFLCGNGISLRTIEESDLGFVQNNLNDAELRKRLDIELPHNTERTREIYQNVFCGSGVHLLIWTRDTRVGYVNATQLDRESGSARLGVWIDPDHQRNGFATTALELVTQYLFDHHRLRKVGFQCYATNAGVQAISDTLGFKQDGVLRDETFTNGEYVDVIEYSVLRSEWETRDSASQADS